MCLEHHVLQFLWSNLHLVNVICTVGQGGQLQQREGRSWEGFPREELLILDLGT